MPPSNRNPPDGPRRVSWVSVVVGDRDTPRDKPSGPENQAAARGLIPIRAVAAEIVADMKFRRLVRRLHRLGPRVTAELLAELGAERSLMTLIDQKLDTYTELEPEVLAATGGDDFWPAPLSEV